jgi:hypothetical protein
MIVSFQTKELGQPPGVPDPGPAKPLIPQSSNNTTEVAHGSNVKRQVRAIGTDAWSFSLGAYNSYLMRVIEAGEKARYYAIRVFIHTLTQGIPEPSMAIPAISKAPSLT